MQFKVLIVLLSALALSGSYTIGNLKGTHTERDKWLLVQAKYNQEVVGKNILIAALTESYNVSQQQLNITLEDKRDAIQQNAVLIDKYNVISKRYFLRYLQPNKVHLTNHTAESTIADDTVPATGVLDWTVGLQAHDNQCVIQLDGLIAAIKIINSHMDN